MDENADTALWKTTLCNGTSSFIDKRGIRLIHLSVRQMSMVSCKSSIFSFYFAFELLYRVCAVTQEMKCVHITS